MKPKKKTAVADKVREDSEDEDEDDSCSMDLPPQCPPQPPAPVEKTPVIAHDVTETDSVVPAAPLLLEGNDDNHSGCQNQDAEGNNLGDTGEDATPHRPQRQRRPPKTLRYDKDGTPSCYMDTAMADPAPLFIWDVN